LRETGLANRKEKERTMARRIEDVDENLRLKKASQTRGTQWVKASSRRFTQRGLAWLEEDRSVLRRMPGRAEGVVPDGVWYLAQCLAGGRVCFRSDTTLMKVRAALLREIPYPHMPATGHSGLALYVGGPHEQKPWNMAFPDFGRQEFERDLFTGVSKEMREYSLYLPPYNGLVSLDIGLSAGARIQKPSPHLAVKPAVFYGTSITQGGCANNAGGDYPSIVSRALNLDVVNLGFSGCGQGEPEVARMIGEIDAGLFALDYVANVTPEQLRRTLPPFVKILREAHPKTSIVLMGKIVYTTASHDKAYLEQHEQRRDIMIHFYSKQRKAGDENIHFVDGDALIPYGADLSHVDGGHPTGAGFNLMAERLIPQIARVLEL
jgi:hypothetical protein